MTVFQADQPGKGRVAELAAIGQLLLVEGLEIVTGGGPDDVVLGLESLQDHLTTQRAAPGAPGDLGQHLEGALIGAVIGQVQPHVCQNGANQCHQRQIHAL